MRTTPATQKVPGFPLYKLIEQEPENTLLTAEDIQGFFIDPGQEPPENVTFNRVHDFTQHRRKTEETALQVINHRQEVIGSYYIGRTVRLTPDSNAADNDPPQVAYTFFGHSCEYANAQTVWRRWASDQPLELHEWAQYPAAYHASWLHVAQTAWFTSGLSAARYGTNEIAIINGKAMKNKASFFCAIGEAVKGPGGYFGSNLDALADCLSSSQESTHPLRVLWKDSDTSREGLGEAFVTAVTSVLHEFDVEVCFR